MPGVHTREHTHVSTCFCPQALWDPLPSQCPHLAAPSRRVGPRDCPLVSSLDAGPGLVPGRQHSTGSESTDPSAAPRARGSHAIRATAALSNHGSRVGPLPAEAAPGSSSGEATAARAASCSPPSLWVLGKQGRCSVHIPSRAQCPNRRGNTGITGTCCVLGPCPGRRPPCEALVPCRELARVGTWQRPSSCLRGCQLCPVLGDFLLLLLRVGWKGSAAEAPEPRASIFPLPPPAAPRPRHTFGH